MKKIICFLLVIGGLYGSVGNTLVNAGVASIEATESRMAKAGV